MYLGNLFASNRSRKRKFIAVFRNRPRLKTGDGRCIPMSHRHINGTAENVSIAEVMSFHIMPMNMSHSCKFGGYVVQVVGWLVDWLVELRA